MKQRKRTKNIICGETPPLRLVRVCLCVCVFVCVRVRCLLCFLNEERRKISRISLSDMKKGDHKQYENITAEFKKLWLQGVERKKESLEKQGIQPDVLFDKCEAIKREYQEEKSQQISTRRSVLIATERRGGFDEPVSPLEEVKEKLCVECGSPVTEEWHKLCPKCYHESKVEEHRTTLEDYEGESEEYVL